MAKKKRNKKTISEKEKLILLCTYRKIKNLSLKNKKSDNKAGIFPGFPGYIKLNNSCAVS